MSNGLPSFAIHILIGCFVLSSTCAGQSTVRVSIGSGGSEANGASGGAVISVDGRIVAFPSLASNLVSGDTNGTSDVFVLDRLTGITTRVSVDSGGAEIAAPSDYPSISADGRYVAFETTTHPKPGHTVPILFVRDRELGVTTLVCATPASGRFFSSVSADGRSIAYVCFGFFPTTQVYVSDLQSGTRTQVSVNSSGEASNGSDGFPSISADARWVSFFSTGTNLVSKDSNGVGDVFVHDRQTGTTTRVSVGDAGAQANGASLESSISVNGRFVTFRSLATNLVLSDTNAVSDVFVHDRDTGTTSRISLDSSGIEGNGESLAPWISGDGRLVAFSSLASNLIPGDSNSAADTFVRDRQTGTTMLASVDSGGNLANGQSSTTSISFEGRYVSFSSSASNLVTGDTNGVTDAFVHDRGPGCASGTVNVSSGSVPDVLRVNGRTVLAPVSTGASIQVTLEAAPGGPSPGQYVVWAWSNYSVNSTLLLARGEVLGCTVNPTPLSGQFQPQPSFCIRGNTIPARACRGVTVVQSPPSAPWTVTRSLGIARPAVFTLQGVLEDSSSTNSARISVTNAVVIQIQ